MLILHVRCDSLIDWIFLISPVHHEQWSQGSMFGVTKLVALQKHRRLKHKWIVLKGDIDTALGPAIWLSFTSLSVTWPNWMARKISGPRTKERKQDCVLPGNISWFYFSQLILWSPRNQQTIRPWRCLSYNVFSQARLPIKSYYRCMCLYWFLRSNYCNFDVGRGGFNHGMLVGEASITGCW